MIFSMNCWQGWDTHDGVSCLWTPPFFMLISYIMCCRLWVFQDFQWRRRRYPWQICRHTCTMTALVLQLRMHTPVYDKGCATSYFHTPSSAPFVEFCLLSFSSSQGGGSYKLTFSLPDPTKQRCRNRV